MKEDPTLPDYELLAPLRFDGVRDADRAAKARVLGRLEATIGAIGAGVAVRPQHATPDEGTIAAPRAATSPPVPSLRAGPPALSAFGGRSAARTTRSLVASFIAHRGALIATGFVVGGVSGAGIHAALGPPRESVVYLDRPFPVPEPRPFIAPVPEFGGHGAKAEENSANVPKEPPIASSTMGTTDLAGERALLDRARMALAQGNSVDAERALSQHAHRYPTGLLLEEREALAIKTFVDMGRIDEARRRAARFSERFPSSIFGPAVDETLGAVR